jgi:chromosome segregation ATPase
MNQETDKFDVLEEKITKLVEAYSTLQDEKTSLGEELAQRDLEIQKLKDKISHLSREREIAREKVEGLLNRVERLISPAAGIGIGKG